MRKVGVPAQSLVCARLESEFLLCSIPDGCGRTNLVLGSLGQKHGALVPSSGNLCSAHSLAVPSRPGFVHIHNISEMKAAGVEVGASAAGQN